MRKIYNLILIVFVLSLSYGADAQHYAKNASEQPATYVTPSKGDEALRGAVKEGVELRYPNRVITLLL